ncbi:ecdysteroid 22-kinase family protein [Mycolicibacterium rufum]|uniref:Ecdysteroid 22-kinase family protein n=1 Tax=Mycolicibacterium rufum TaxID=318424 RepID=A0A9X3BH74_9MYCO|nr:phosphotransferase [Mycolicibacterium rufum]KGI70938.1 phosphotransferase [Mycolicibacterium rufum]MCV7071274.1 phosphotransferase [Mycolicibacterium rufum]ULP34674.1 ecdysteroid 22-kinase family protein [Mycolicibacterium rufum]
MSSPRPPLIESPADLTAEWLTTALGRGTVADFSVTRIGTGQMSECYRVALDYADGEQGPASVVLKVAAADPSSRQTGLAMGLYEREVRFYSDIAPGLGGPVAPCHHAAYDPATGVFDLLLDDAAPATVGDEIRGASGEQAALALRQLGLVHGPLLGDEALAGAEWINRESPVNQGLMSALYAGFIDRYRDQVAPEHREVCERFVASFDAYSAAEDTAGGRRGLVHGDYRLDNMLFGQDGADRPLTVVDWQTVTWGPAFTDVAYFLGCALPTEQRRAHYDDLLAAYHEALGPAAGVTLDEVREGVRRQSFFGVLMAIVSPMLVAQTERGDEMFMAMIARHCQHVLDTDALSLLPAPSTPEPLQPEASDEGRHPPTDEPLWSESWYFDFADAAQRVGGWIRLGIIPNQGHAWINGLLCGPGMPTVAVLDFEAPLPQDHTRVRSETAELAMDVVEPLAVYRVSLHGRGAAYDDPAALLRGETGRPVELTMDLTWTTVGAAYQYRVSPRYEIPCQVTGTVTVDGQPYAFTDVVGQRDHSWASRDWWSMDWVWSALHLDDGTHLHGVDIRIPGAPPLSVGYEQSPGGPLVELATVDARETMWDNELPISGEVVYGDLGATVTVLGHAPVLLTSPDGRLSRFPRAWGSVVTSDGRTGVGWIEWNRSQG